MLQAQIVKPNEPLKINKCEIPNPPSKGAVIKISFSGICHSDIHQWENELDLGVAKIKYTDIKDYKLPVTPGHEVSGIVHSLGNNVDGSIKVGDTVGVYSWMGCGECLYCGNEDYSSCLNHSYCMGMLLPGGYATHVAVRDCKYIVKLPDNLPLNVACMLACSGLTAYNAVKKISSVVEKSTAMKGKAAVLIIGAGGLGLWSLQIAKHILPSTTKIVVADIGENKLGLAKSLGCDATVLWDKSLNERQITQLTVKEGYGGGFDATLDFVNSSVTSFRAVASVIPNGMLVMVGLFGGSANFPLPQIVLGTRTIHGVFTGSLQSFKELIKLMETAKLEPPPIKYFSLDEATDAVTLLKEGNMNGRGIFRFDSSSLL